jgi:formylglycine-generating enzyme required for sulfatase activity
VRDVLLAILVGILGFAGGASAEETFKDCSECPLMVKVPAGTFTMGGPSGYGESLPRHQVTIGYQFAVGRFALTFDEWDACVADGGCNGYRPSDNGWGRGRRPVINVSWNDAKAYVAWLSRKTGQTYRLLSEAEYEYATRAGTTTRYPWGDDVGEKNAKCIGCDGRDIYPWETQKRGTVPVGSFPPNKFGLCDMVGNVDQWMEDCKHLSYEGAPADGSAWTSGPHCNEHILRGGNFFIDALSSDVRSWKDSDLRNRTLGFRVARTLKP